MVFFAIAVVTGTITPDASDVQAPKLPLAVVHPPVRLNVSEGELTI